MIRYIITKILNKFKLYFCLMIGNISIIMIFALMMMFRDGSCMKLIQKGFTNQYEQSGGYPASIERTSTIKPNAIEDNPEEVVEKNIVSYEDSWRKYLDLPVISSQRYVGFRGIEGEYSYRDAGYIGFGYIEDMMKDDTTDISEHLNFVSGGDLNSDISKYTEKGVSIPEGALPCLVSKYTADSYGLVVGEIIEFYKVQYGKNSEDKPLITLYINGIVTEKEGDYFWNIPLEEMGNTAFIDKAEFYKIVDEYPKEIQYKTKMFFDYRYVNTDNIYEVEDVVGQFVKKDDNLSENFTSVIKDYKEKSKSVGQMLYVIVLPLVILVLLFIGMIAFRIIDSENGELSTLRNRGLSKFRLINMYLIQSFILAGISLPIGVGIGYLFGKLVAGVDDFMGFGFNNDISVRDYRMNSMMIAAGAIGALIAVIMMMIPVFVVFKKKKTKRMGATLPTWEKYFLDIILLVISVYLLINYNKQIPTLSVGVMKGEGIDPVIFIDSTLFLFACGMLMLRLIFYVARLIYKLREKKFGPVTYAGMVQILRTRKASGVISIFLVMTVAMSVFNASMARTINANKEARLQLESGADVRIQENWYLQLMRENPGAPIRWEYHEPSYETFNELKDNGTFEELTKVLVTDRAYVGTKGKETADVTYMAINTKEFGHTAKLRNDLSEKHWYNYLNALAAEPDGIIISRSVSQKFGVKVGDSMNVYMKEPKVCNTSQPYATENCKIVAIVDAWPGFNSYYYKLDETGNMKEYQNYLVVGNFSTAYANFRNLPYEIWASVGDEAGTDEFGEGIYEDEIREKVEEAFGDSGRTLKSINSWKTNLKEEKSSAIIQITNGLFTADFLVAIILCIVGYMIYWITSIRDRELLFGIYRAQGITKKEINRMLIIEQTFLSIVAIIAGIIAGVLASRFFAKVFAAVYLPQKHSVSVFVSEYGGDMLRLGGVLLIVVAVCVIWIRRIVRGLNITEALKLGEDS